MVVVAKSTTMRNMRLRNRLMGMVMHARVILGINLRRQHQKKEKSACAIVETLLNGKETLDTIDNCNKKNDKTWDCKDDTFNQHNKGACMPPRRQSLCIHDLKELTKDSSENDMRKAFINCSAIETHFLWKYYTEQNRSTKNELNKETIPKNFIRWMEYTYGDYRDIFFGKDISNDTKIKTISDNVNKILKIEKITKEEEDSKKEQWWKKNGTEIWEGMLCALEKASGDKVTLNNKPTYPYSTVTFSGNNSTTLEEFAQTPQFLRWYIEWSDDFCTERQKKEEKIEKDCTQDKEYEGCEEKNNSGSCVNACKEYKKLHYRQETTI